jgi:hypothetical protein
MKQRQASQIGSWIRPSQLAVLGNLRTLIPGSLQLSAIGSGITAKESVWFSMFLFVA